MNRASEAALFAALQPSVHLRNSLPLHANRSIVERNGKDGHEIHEIFMEQTLKKFKHLERT